MAEQGPATSVMHRSYLLDSLATRRAMISRGLTQERLTNLPSLSNTMASAAVLTKLSATENMGN